jgi:hypothetical protein
VPTPDLLLLSNLLGRYHFALPEAILRGELRKRRDPNDVSDQTLE